MPPKSKARSAPNQHDKRHESGLAQPGKRVSKKQSNGHLNALLDGKPVSSGQPAAQQTSSSTPASGPALVYSSDSQDGVAASLPQQHVGSTERDRTYSDASFDEMAPCGEMQQHHSHNEHAAASPSAEAQQPVYRAKPPTSGSSPTVSTILSYYPLRDAISILILLLSLPPTLVLVIQTLFASLTFVPPTTSISLTTLPNIKEIFNSSNMGYPALATILIVDLIFWVCWLPVWKPMQGIFLDFSQAVIAVSLSGAAASASGPTYSVATTTIIVCIVHVLRYRAIHLTSLDYLRSVLHKVDIGIQIDVPSFATSYASLPPVDRGWIYTVIRTILGIHIVSQGVTTAIRHSLVKANEQSANVPAITKTEADSNSTSEANGRLAPNHAEGPSPAASVASPDTRPPGLSPARRDSKPRESTAKKKKKQVDRIRGRQPLWAAIASTKVTFVKGQEQKDAMDDAREAARVQFDNTNTIATNFINSTARAWVREVHDTEVCFSVQLPPDATVQGVNDLEEGTSLGAGIDKSKPFFVRINGATWSSTRIRLASTDESSFGSNELYDGEIFGLAPMSSYLCEIVDIASQKLLCEVSIITQPAPTPEQAAATPAPPQHQALRPASPITTLKQAVSTAEAKLAETKNRSKKGKRDQRGGTIDIKKEIGTLKGKLDSSGGSDDKQKSRLLQLNQHRAQAEEVMSSTQAKIDGMGEAPADEVAASQARHSDWQSTSNDKKTANKEFEDGKAVGTREITDLKSEVTQAESKKEKFGTRSTQRKQELEKLISRQEADMTAKQKRDHERSQILAHREHEEKNIHSHVGRFEEEYSILEGKTHDSYQQITALQNWSSSQQPPPYPGHSSPPTPETALAVNGSLHSPQANGFPPFNPPPQQPNPFSPVFHSANPSLSSAHPGGGAPPPPHQPRGRSSSMLSQYSGFTDNGEEYSFSPEQQPLPPRMQFSWPIGTGPGVLHATTAAGLMDDRKESEGSGSASLNNGSTGSNSPRPEARPFVPGTGNGNGNGKPVGTIGPPSKKGPQSPVAAHHGVVGSGR